MDSPSLCGRFHTKMRPVSGSMPLSSNTSPTNAEDTPLLQDTSPVLCSSSSEPGDLDELGATGKGQFNHTIFSSIPPDLDSDPSGITNSAPNIPLILTPEDISPQDHCKVNCFGSGRIFPSPRSPKPIKPKPSPLSFSPHFHFSPLSPARSSSPEPKKRLSMSMSSPVNCSSSSTETRSAFDFVCKRPPVKQQRDVGIQCTLLQGRPLVWPPPPPASPAMTTHPPIPSHPSSSMFLPLSPTPSTISGAPVSPLALPNAPSLQHPVPTNPTPGSLVPGLSLPTSGVPGNGVPGSSSMQQLQQPMTVSGCSTNNNLMSSGSAAAAAAAPPAGCPIASVKFPITNDESRSTDSPDSITIEVHDYGTPPENPTIRVWPSEGALPPPCSPLAVAPTSPRGSFSSCGSRSPRRPQTLLPFVNGYRNLATSDMELYKGSRGRAPKLKSPACLDGAAVSLVQLPTSSIDEDEPIRPGRYRADSLVSPPPGYPRNSRIFGYSSDFLDMPPEADLGERSDTLSSPRISPVPWLGNPNGEQQPPGAPQSFVFNGDPKPGSSSGRSERKSSNLLTVPKPVLGRSCSGSFHSTSDESDTEPSPPISRRGRRKAVFDSKSFGTGPGFEDISPVASCDEGDPSGAGGPRSGRKRSSVDLGINYPGDLLVHDRQRKVLIKRNTIADFAATRAYHASTTSLISDNDNKKLKGTFSLLKLIDKKSGRGKDNLPVLRDVLSKIKPSTFKDNYLTCYKDLHWSELIASTDKEQLDTLNISEGERKRREAVWELFRSECVFLIDHLMVLKHCFMEPLKKTQVEGHLMFAEPQDLFGNLDELCYVSYTFCRDFISLLLKDAWVTEFGRTDVLVKASQRLGQLSRDGEVYHTYCLQYSKAVNYLEQLRKNDDFIEFEKWCEHDSRCHRLQLTDLLISPMQHCTKVPLLLSNIRRYTDSEEEQQQLTESLEKLETSLKNLEAKMKWLKNFERVQTIQQQIQWQPITEMEPRAFIPEFLKSTLTHQPCERLLASPKRQLVHEGPLTLLEISKSIDMYLFLFDDILLLTKVKKPPRKQKDGGSYPQTDGALFTVHRQPIALDRFTIHDVRPPDTNAQGLKNAFVLVQISRFQQIIGVYTLQAPTEGAKTQWMCRLQNAQDAYKNAIKRNEGQPSTPTLLAPPGASSGPSNSTTPVAGGSSRASPETPTNTAPVPSTSKAGLFEGTSSSNKYGAAAPPSSLPGVTEESVTSSQSSLTAAPVSPPVKLVDVTTTSSSADTPGSGDSQENGNTVVQGGGATSTSNRRDGGGGAIGASARSGKPAASAVNVSTKASTVSFIRGANSIQSIDNISLTTGEGSSSSGSDTPVQLLPPPPSKADITRRGAFSGVAGNTDNGRRGAFSGNMDNARRDAITDVGGHTARLVRAQTHASLPNPTRWGTPPPTQQTGIATGNTAMPPLSGSCSNVHQKLRKTLSGSGSTRRPLFRKDLKATATLSPPTQRKGRLGTLKALHDKAKSMDVMFV